MGGDAVEDCVREEVCVLAAALCVFIADCTRWCHMAGPMGALGGLAASCSMREPSSRSSFATGAAFSSLLWRGKGARCSPWGRSAMPNHGASSAVALTLEDGAMLGGASGRAICSRSVRMRSRMPSYVTPRLPPRAWMSRSEMCVCWCVCRVPRAFGEAIGKSLLPHPSMTSAPPARAGSRWPPPRRRGSATSAPQMASLTGSKSATGSRAAALRPSTCCRPRPSGSGCVRKIVVSRRVPRGLQRPAPFASTSAGRSTVTRPETHHIRAAIVQAPAPTTQSRGRQCLNKSIEGTVSSFWRFLRFGVFVYYYRLVAYPIYANGLKKRPVDL